MSVASQWMESQKGITKFEKIKCPRNYVLKQGCNPFKIVPNPMLKNMKQEDINHFNKEHGQKLKKWMYARDKAGNKIQNFDSYFQPEVSKPYVLEHIYDPSNPICKMQCRGRCLHGIGNVNLKTIGRLSRAKDIK